MVARRKNKFERLLSFNQHKKRFGAKKVAKDMERVDYDLLKSTIIEGDKVVYTHGSDKSLDQHLANLKNEFCGQSELIYHHAKLIVLIRREFDSQKNALLLIQLWEAEEEFLLKNLNTRWLVAAADTFAEYSEEPSEKALALTTSILINTLKLVETERFMQGVENTPDDANRLDRLSQGRVDLFDGTSAFAVGTDDTLRNLRWRLNDLCCEGTICSKILVEIFNRIQNTETIYKRFRLRHIRNKTKWW